MGALPKEQAINPAPRPASHTVEFPTPSVGRQALIRPRFLPQENAHEHVEELIDSDQELPAVMHWLPCWHKSPLLGCNQSG